MKVSVIYCLFVFGALMFATSLGIAQQGQQQKDAQAVAPATKLEAFAAKTGVVIIRGYTTIGSINGLGPGSVTVDAREFRDAANLKLRVTGLSIQVKESGRLERESTSFVDYDEIDSLLQGIDYISKIGPDITQMAKYEAEYITKGDFSVTTFNSTNGFSVGVSSGKFAKVTAYFKLDNLAKLKTLLQDGKAVIDSTVQNAN